MLTNAQLDQVLRICGRDPRTVTGAERLRLRAKYTVDYTTPSPHGDRD